MQSKIISFAMHYGIYIGLLIALNTILGISTNAFLRVLSWGVFGAMLYLMYFFTIRFRENEIERQVFTFGNAFRLNILMYFFGAMVATAIRIIYFKWLNSDCLDEIYNQSMQILEQSGSIGDMNLLKDTMSKVVQPTTYSFILLFGDFFSGIFYALIIAAITRTKTPSVESDSTEKDIIDE